MTYEEKVWDTFIRAYRGDLQAQAEILYVDAILNGDSRLIKEEKKMLNVDKYRDEIDRMIAIGGAKPSIVITRMCLEKTNLNSIDTAVALDWLFSEHEPQLLENGDDLKPGDWIMVKDFNGGKWLKRQFLFYYNGRFYCELVDNSIGHGEYISWMQARLPEEGE